MNITLGNFEFIVDPLVLDRGLDYYEEGLVFDLMQLSDNDWQAMVEGNVDYRVRTTIQDDVILDWSCDCPFDFGPICKHVVAVWYEIREGQTPDGGTLPAEEIPRPEKIDELLREVSDADLRDFVRVQLLTNDELFRTFTLTFGKPAEGSQRDTVKRHIDQLIGFAGGRKGFIDYRHSFALMDELWELLNQADDFTDISRWDNALSICQAVIEKIPEIISTMDDSAGMSTEVFDRACELCEDFALSQSFPDVRKQLFDFLIQEFPKEKYHARDMHLEFLPILELLLDDEEQEQQYLAVLDQAISLTRVKEFREPMVEDLLLTKRGYYLAKGQTGQAQRILEENREYYAIRKILVDQHMRTKNYSEAEKLILEGIELAQKEDLPGLVAQWKEELLKLYAKTGNQSGIREVAEELFFSGFPNMEYYRRLKKTYPPDQWKNKWPELVGRLREKKNQLFFDAFVLAQIYVEEKQYEKLLKLLQEYPENLYLVDEFYKRLSGQFPSEVLEVFRTGINHLVKNANRKNYEKAVYYLKKMQRIEGGKSVVSEMVQHYGRHYKNRPAMMEVLKRLRL
ncbi:MAG: hypothetical protein EH225_04580 [Calditrichaeota bacterium]|nr:MAG: hypothetical protein EH225_04580 [Calditrichota bacterium]